MKITKRQLRRIIKEEKARLLNETRPSEMSMHDAAEFYSQSSEPDEGYIQSELHMEVMDFLNDMTELSFKGSDMIKKRATELVNKIEG